MGNVWIINADMRIVLLGSGSIIVNMSGSSPNLKTFEAIYGLRGNNLASINSKLMKNGINKVPFWWFMQALFTMLNSK